MTWGRRGPRPSISTGGQTSTLERRRRLSGQRGLARFLGFAATGQERRAFHQHGAGYERDQDVHGQVRVPAIAGYQPKELSKATHRPPPSWVPHILRRFGRRVSPKFLDGAGSASRLRAIQGAQLALGRRASLR